MSKYAEVVATPEQAREFLNMNVIPNKDVHIVVIWEEHEDDETTQKKTNTNSNEEIKPKGSQ